MAPLRDLAQSGLGRGAGGGNLIVIERYGTDGALEARLVGVVVLVEARAEGHVDERVGVRVIEPTHADGLEEQAARLAEHLLAALAHVDLTPNTTIHSVQLQRRQPVRQCVTEGVAARQG